MTADNVPTDAALQLAKAVGSAIAAAGNREELFEAAHRVLCGPDRLAQRLGGAVAAAVIDALREYRSNG